MRIVAFVGHPLAETLNQCEDLGKFLRRANISIDIINFANPENVPKLQALASVVDKDREISSHFMDVPLGMSSITDLLFTSPILGFGGDGGAGAGGLSEYGGVNPDIEPDLAMALKLSMEEAKAQQKKDQPETTAPIVNAAGSEPALADDEMEEHDEQYYLDQAIKLSLMEDEQKVEA